MENKKDAVIVSAFGRGHWLAAELAGSGLSVSLVDVSAELGRWTPEDWEGPFGFFRADNLRESQVARLNEEDYHDSVNQGFTVWLRKGPIDLKGPHSSYLMAHEGLDQKVEHYLSEYCNLDKQNRKEFQSELDQQEFKKSWLAHLAHQMAATTYYDNSESLQHGDPLPVFSDYFVRRVSRRGFEKNLEWVSSKGVQVFAKAKLRDLVVEGKNIQSIEVESAQSGVIHGERFIWMLTSEETQRFPKLFAEKLFPQGAVKPQWSWVRYRVQLAEGPFTDALPVTFVMIDDLFLPWTHTNLSVVQRTVSPRDLDVWVRIPNHQRFQRNYLEKMSRQIVEAFKERIPACEANCLEMPQDYLYDYDELGPARFPVYSSESRKSSIGAKYKNLNFDSPENWSRLDWTGQMNHQNKIFEDVLQWKASLKQ